MAIINGTKSRLTLSSNINIFYPEKVAGISCPGYLLTQTEQEWGTTILLIGSSIDASNYVLAHIFSNSAAAGGGVDLRRSGFPDVEIHNGGNLEQLEVFFTQDRLNVSVNGIFYPLNPQTGTGLVRPGYGITNYTYYVDEGFQSAAPNISGYTGQPYSNRVININGSNLTNAENLRLRVSNLTDGIIAECSLSQISGDDSIQVMTVGQWKVGGENVTGYEVYVLGEVVYGEDNAAFEIVYDYNGQEESESFGFPPIVLDTVTFNPTPADGELPPTNTEVKITGTGIPDGISPVMTPADGGSAEDGAGQPIENPKANLEGEVNNDGTEITSRLGPIVGTNLLSTGMEVLPKIGPAIMKGGTGLIKILKTGWTAGGGLPGIMTSYFIGKVIDGAIDWLTGTSKPIPVPPDVDGNYQ